MKKVLIDENNDTFLHTSFVTDNVDAVVNVTQVDDTLTIGNGYISRVFSVNDNKLVTIRIVNKRMDGHETVLAPDKYSEEFKIRTVKTASDKNTTDEKREFCASNLTLASNGIAIENTTALINNVQKTGKKLTFSFMPYTHKNVDYSVKEIIIMYDGDHFMRKFLEISVASDQKSNAVIDYIDLEYFVIKPSYAQWTIPNVGDIVKMEEYKANLGQPFYVQGMFFGCEFPVADTKIEGTTARVRYYSGKSFAQLEVDNQLNPDGTTYMTWQTVAGAARSTDNSVIQSDFFEYIDSISTPSEFRIQYNSWFDNMMFIDDKSIRKSFIAIENGLTSNGVRPLDSYVVDDGWNNYNTRKLLLSTTTKARRSGTTANSSGFWEFNSKFPNGFTPSSELVGNLGSNFGVWVGPRGGYNYFGDLANIMVKSNMGSKLGGSIDVADRNYLKNFEAMAIGFQKAYGVNYWKLDGFADNMQYASAQKSVKGVGDGVPGRLNNHMVGGYHQMYHVTDLWEGWIDLFDNVRASAELQGINNLWISITCYVNPSPWYLQWVNSVWMQCNLDRGENGPLNDKMNGMLTYRDAAYYCFNKEHEFQFPLKAIYNHDPIFGVEDTGIDVYSMTDEQFQNYLYEMAGRGSSFWELYFSDSIMTRGKYEATAEFLAWAEENFHILRHAKMIGGNPSGNVTLHSNPKSKVWNTYGFSAWDGEEGIITMRNPSNATQTLSFTIDVNIGAAESLKGKTIYRTTVHSYNVGDESNYKTLNYGDTLLISLKPGEVRTWKLSSQRNVVAPRISRVYFEDSKTLVVKFSEKMTYTGSTEAFKVNGCNITNVEQSIDKVTYRITLEKSPADKAKLTVKVSDQITDLNFNACHQTGYVSFRSNDVLYSYDNVTSKRVINSDYAIDSNNPFSIVASIRTSSSNVIISRQEGGYTLGIDGEGNAYMELDGTRVTSKITVNSGEICYIVGVKEANGILKIYLNGKLSNSAYNYANKNYVMPNGVVTIAEGLTNGSILSITAYEKALSYNDVNRNN